MIVVEVSWVNQRGTLQAVRARMENKSAGGARIRIRTPIEVGSKLKIQWRWEQFSGIAKYCLSDGMEYLLGIQRDKKSGVLTRPVPTARPVRNGVRSSDPPVSYKIQSPPKLQSKPSEIRAAQEKVEAIPIVPVAKFQESKPSEIPVAYEKVEAVPIITAASGTTAIPARDAGNEIDGRRPRISQTPNLDALRATEPQTKEPPQESKLARKGHICDEKGSTRHFGATNRTIPAEAATEKATAQARRGILCPRWLLFLKNCLRVLQGRASQTAPSSCCHGRHLPRGWDHESAEGIPH